MSRWADAFAALSGGATHGIHDDICAEKRSDDKVSPCVTSVIGGEGSIRDLPVHVSSSVACVTDISRLGDGVKSLDTLAPTTPLHGMTHGTHGDTLASERSAPQVSPSVTSVTGLGASDPDSAIDLLASELLSRAGRNPAITITDRTKALDYFRTRAAAGGVESKSAAKSPQPERPPTIGKPPMVAEIIRIWPGARFVQFIDE